MTETRHSKAMSTLATIVADFGDYSRQCGRGLTGFIDFDSGIDEYHTFNL